MKATIAVTCFFSAIMLISAITKEECEAPHAQSLCGDGVTPQTTYYYNNGTGQCERYFGCTSGPNNFPTKKECREKCPYGKYAPSG
uniref:Putative salivary kunitz domain protein n=1 Tax=Ixodes ricinus TaxID=34613 RepID=A0A0K8R630_IXORI